MEKSREAFRTISEVAEWLNTPTHVLRFWESRFPEVRPIKRAGGRRYYRPTDMALLAGIKKLLHDDGMTIRGVQKLLNEQGVKFVSGLADVPGDDVFGSPALNGDIWEADGGPERDDEAPMILDAEQEPSPLLPAGAKVVMLRSRSESSGRAQTAPQEAATADAPSDGQPAPLEPAEVPGSEAEPTVSAAGTPPLPRLALRLRNVRREHVGDPQALRALRDQLADLHDRMKASAGE